MSTVCLLAWMAIVSAIMFPDNPGPIVRIIHLVAQSAYLLSGIHEAGTLETGEDSDGRRPSRTLALVMFITCMIFMHFFRGV